MSDMHSAVKHRYPVHATGSKPKRKQGSVQPATHLLHGLPRYHGPLPDCQP